MKIAALFAFYCFFMGTVMPANGHGKHHKHHHDVSQYPHITSQHATPDGGRDVYVHNPLNKPVWVYFECQNVMSVQPTALLPPHMISQVHLKSNDQDVPIEDLPCYLKFWITESHGNVP